MHTIDVVGAIRRKFSETGNPTHVPLLKGANSFIAELTNTGVLVDYLGNQPFLPWTVFQEAICVLI